MQCYALNVIADYKCAARHALTARRDECVLMALVAAYGAMFVRCLPKQPCEQWLADGKTRDIETRPALSEGKAILSVRSMSQVRGDANLVKASRRIDGFDAVRQRLPRRELTGRQSLQPIRSRSMQSPLD
jgi:hypothetical protein